MVKKQKSKYEIYESHKYPGCYHIYLRSSGERVKYFAENDKKNRERAERWVAKEEAKITNEGSQMTAKTEKTPPDKGMVTYDESRLASQAGVGMSKVDPDDIRPPQILLVQKSSDLEQMIDPEGKKPELGEYFHTGKLEIYGEFECYWLYASKGTYIARRKPGQPELEQYRALGVMAKDCSPFGMVFRSSALYTLGSLFSLAKFQNRPMFSFKCRMEVKQLTNQDGTWWIPVLRVLGPEKDGATLQVLEDMARDFDQRGETMTREDEEREEPPIDQSEPH